ncbi:MAG: prolipoprotein diacylglyceryl transferase, partial [Planctomycetia bacterium]
PVLWSLGPVSIYAFGTFIVLAFLLGAFHARRRAARLLGADREQVFNVCFALLFLGIAGARLLYGLSHYAEVTKEPLALFKIWEGGLILAGGLLAGLLWLAWYLPRHPELRGWSMLDVLSMSTALALALGRVGSFLSGEDYGKEAPGLAWAVTFPLESGSQAKPLGVPLHPTQLYHSLHALVVFGLRALLARRSPHPGRVAGAFLMLYALGTAGIEVLRADDQARGMRVDGLVSTTQFLCVPLFFAGLAIWLLRRPQPGSVVTR